MLYWVEQSLIYNNFRRMVTTMWIHFMDWNRGMESVAIRMAVITNVVFVPTVVGLGITPFVIWCLRVATGPM